MNSEEIMKVVQVKDVEDTVYPVSGDQKKETQAVRKDEKQQGGKGIGDRVTMTSFLLPHPCNFATSSGERTSHCQIYTAERNEAF